MFWKYNKHILSKKTATVWATCLISAGFHIARQTSHSPKMNRRRRTLLVSLKRKKGTLSSDFYVNQTENQMGSKHQEENEEPTQKKKSDLYPAVTDNCFSNTITNAKGGERFKIRLKKDAVQTIFSEYPSYHAIIHKPQEKTAGFQDAGEDCGSPMFSLTWEHWGYACC